MCNIKAFIAGMAFPATALPFAYAILYKYGPETIQSQPFQFLPLFLPIVFGVYNILYIDVTKKATEQNKNKALWIMGAGLGLAVAMISVFFIQLPMLLFGIENAQKFIPLITVPIIYSLIWRYIVKYCNTLLNVK